MPGRRPRVMRRRNIRVGARRKWRVMRGGAVRMNRARQPVHYFKRTVYYSGLISGSTTGDLAGSIIGQLNAVPNFSEFTSLFDMYKINGLKVRFSPRANSAEVGTNQGLIKFFSCIDYDDSTAITLPEMLQYESIKQTSSNRDHVRFVKPRVARSVYQSPLVTAYSAGRTWLDCNNTAVPHYGIKYLIQQLPAGNQSYDVSVTYYMAFKNVV